MDQLHEVFVLRIPSTGRWKFEVHRDGQEIGGGVGFEDQFEAIEGAQEAFGHLELRFVVQGPAQDP